MIKNLALSDKETLRALLADYERRFEEIQSKHLKLDLSRGKPDANQLDLSTGMFEILKENSDFTSESGLDCRNYGALDGIPEAKKMMADLLDVKPENVLVGGNSSLNLMYDALTRSMLFGVGGNPPFCRQKNLKFLCPSPGYDRHFAITQELGFELIPVKMTESGPDMDAIEELVKDEAVKGVWCVPKYSNPTGCVYSDETVKRFAALKPAAKDFRIYWDNAYCVHFIYPERRRELLNILDECEKAGNPDMVYEFTSTSKITFSGAGVSAIASSVANIEEIKKHMAYQTIGFDKINQLRHARYFKDKNGIMAHMEKQAELLRPKFETVLTTMDEAFDGEEICSYTRPDGGYFISFDSLHGCAKKIVAKCKEGGVTLTGAGATFPYGIDPDDCNIRIAPTFASLEDIATAVRLFCICVHIVSIQKLLEK